MNALKKIVSFYYQGFKNMTWGKTVWVVILIKLFVFFFIMKMFFFPNILQKNFSTDEERSAHVLENLTNTK
jgi:Na+/H+ antiporter NhaD/arsenite permease-like protein